MRGNELEFVGQGRISSVKSILDILVRGQEEVLGDSGQVRAVVLVESLELAEDRDDGAVDISSPDVDVLRTVFFREQLQLVDVPLLHHDSQIEVLSHAYGS